MTIEDLKKKYDEYTVLKNGLIEVVLNKKHGLINEEGTIIIPIIYTSLCMHDKAIEADKYEWQTEESKITIYDFTGKILVEECYSARFEDKFIAIEPHSNFNGIHTVKLINYDGHYLTALEYDAYAYNNGDLISVCYKDRWGVIDIDGAKIIPYKYDRISAYAGKYTTAIKNGKWGFLDNKGNELTNFEFDKCCNINPDGYAIVSKNKKIQRINVFA